MTCFRFVLSVALRFVLPSEGRLSLMHGHGSSCATSDCQCYPEEVSSRILFKASEVLATPWAVVMVQRFTTKSGSTKETDGQELRNLPEKRYQSKRNPPEKSYQLKPAEA